MREGHALLANGMPVTPTSIQKTETLCTLPSCRSLSTSAPGMRESHIIVSFGSSMKYGSSVTACLTRNPYAAIASVTASIMPI
jgi:hypothetical protein